MQTMWRMAVCAMVAGTVALPLSAQTQTAPADAAKSAPKAAPAKKPSPPKAAAKDDKKKAAAPAKKADGKTATKNPMVRPTKEIEPIRDDKGKVIPITPDAYDVSSAFPDKSPQKKK